MGQVFRLGDYGKNSCVIMTLDWWDNMRKPVPSLECLSYDSFQ